VAFGKVVNAGQTCVAPDYVLVQESRLEMFLDGYRRALTEFFPYGDYSSMPRILNDKHFRRLEGLMQSGRIVQGGRTDAARRRIFPTVLVDVSPEDPVMQEEIFGPVLPILEYEYAKDAIDYIEEIDKPLALYVFTENPGFARYFVDHLRYGGGCINDCIIHLANSTMGFGGVGESGMGAYHGEAGFDCFSHQKGIVDKKTWIDLKMRYQPYSQRMEKLVRMFLK
jgi:aldehyde dehydrogenase (NAD+)